MVSRKRLVRVYGNGNGTFYVRCHWCHTTSESRDSADDLRLLADVKKQGWEAVMIEADGQYRLSCARCVRSGQVGA